jgi:hypothetical protein
MKPDGLIQQTRVIVPTRQLSRVAESIPWNRFLDSFNVYKFGLWLAESIPWNGFLGSVKIYKFLLFFNHYI